MNSLPQGPAPPAPAPVGELAPTWPGSPNPAPPPPNGTPVASVCIAAPGQPPRKKTSFALIAIGSLALGLFGAGVSAVASFLLALKSMEGTFNEEPLGVLLASAALAVIGGVVGFVVSVFASAIFLMIKRNE